jgi:hypothetical protein
MSCLVEPLVAPLVGRSANVRARRSGVARSRLGASALLMTAVMAVGTHATAGDLLERDAKTRAAEKTHRNAHKPGDAVPLRDVGRVFGHQKALHDPEREGVRVPRPGLAPRFEWDAILASRARHAIDLTRAPSPGLGRGVRADRLSRSRPPTFLRFGSGEHRSGPPSPVRV